MANGPEDRHRSEEDPSLDDVENADETEDVPPTDDRPSRTDDASEGSSTDSPEATHQYETGDVITGEVVNIKPYGAFVELPDGETGLIHISEVDEAYVKDVHDYLTVGQEIAVKVVGIHDSGKYNLSVRQLSSRERDSAFYSRQMREFNRELEVRRDEIRREANWRQATQQQQEDGRLSHETERADLEAWIEKARDLTDEARQKSEERRRSYPLL